MTSQVTNRREGVSPHTAAVVISSAPLLRKSYRLHRRLKNCLVRRLLVGGVPALEVVEGVKEVK
jgi:hypothetical protein